MSRLDEELKIALARHEPPENFAERIAARIALGQATKEKESERWWRPILRFLISGMPVHRLLEAPRARWAVFGVVACLILAVFGGLRYREYQRQQEQAELAKAQVMYALQVASTKLNTAQRKALGVASQSSGHSN